MTALTADTKRVIERYVPTGVPPEVWGDVRTVVQEWVCAARPGHRRRALQLLHAGTHLAAWCVAEGIPTAADPALRDSTIERFCAAAERDARFSPTTRATVRAHLRCLAAAHRVPGNLPSPPRLARGRLRPPYRSEDVRGFFALARAQSSPVRRSHLLALLCAGLGAGLSPEDLRRLRGTDIERCSDDAVIANVSGQRPRRVIVLDEYGPELHRLAGEAGPALLLGGRKPDRRSVTSSILSRIEGGADLPPIEPGRLRSTWICTHLAAGVRLDALMAAAGLDSPTSIVDVLRHLDACDPDRAREELRGASHYGALTRANRAIAPVNRSQTVRS